MTSVSFSKPSLLVQILFSIAAKVSVNAQQFARESFDYPAGVELDGLGGSSGGWTSPWRARDRYVSGFLLPAESKSLWFGNRQPFVEDGSSSVCPSLPKGMKRAFVPIDLSQETIYFCVLIRPPAKGARARFEFSDADGNVRLNVGLADDPSDEDELPNLFAHTQNRGYDRVTFGPNIPRNEQNYLLVVKRDRSGVSASVLLGDEQLPAEPSTWQIFVYGESSLTLENLLVAVSLPHLWIDEIRIATSWEDLLGLPSN